jgi:membrane protein
LSPLILLALTIAGSLYLPAQDRLIAEVVALVGPQVEPVLRHVIDSAHDRPDLRSWTGWLSGALLLIGASAVLAQLQGALNQIWACENRSWNGILGFIRRRVLSAGVLLALLFITILSMGVQAAISSTSFGNEGWLWWLSSAVSGLIYAALFTALYHWLPDCKVPWSTAWRGGLLTALLFMLGRVAMATYLANTDAAGAFGAAGGLMLWLLWAYYSALIFLLSAQLLYALSTVRGWQWSGPVGDEKATNAQQSELASSAAADPA